MPFKHWQALHNLVRKYDMDLVTILLAHYDPNMDKSTYRKHRPRGPML